MGLASRGLRDLEGRLEPVTDPGESAAIRRQASRIHRKAAGVALLAGVAALLLP